MKDKIFVCISLVAVIIVISILFGYFGHTSTAYNAQMATTTAAAPIAPITTVIDTVAYDAKMLQLANLPPPKAATPTTVKTTTNSTGVKAAPVAVPAITKPTLWPAKAVYPNPGALLPFNRIVAFYGNFYSKGMGVLGQYPTAQVISMLQAKVKEWQLADPTTPVIPAIHYIATTAQSYKESDGTYILRMPGSQIQKAIDLAKQVNGIVFIDVQLGQSSVQAELPLLAQYLKLPQVHLGLDPEFAMKPGQVPSTVIGTLDATQINWAAQYLAKIVQDNDLPPKILVIHRFTEDMVTNAEKIKPLPEVQIVMDMDGWGNPAKKVGTYQRVIYPEPVQFTGFKLFFQNDLKAPSTRMLTPAEILNLTPRPSYIQYQ